MNLANSITITRIFLVPVILVFLLVRMPYGSFIAAGIFVLAGVTDGLDGYIARKHRQVTKLGKFLDPLADKLLVSSVLVSLVGLGSIAPWVAVVIISREFAVTGLRLVAASEGVVIAASPIAKFKTVTQIVAITAVILGNFPFSYINFPFSTLALWVSVVFTIWSGVDYFVNAREFLQPSN